MSRNAVHKSLKGMEAPAGSVPRELIGAGGLPPAGAYNSRRRRGVAVFLYLKTLPPLPSRFGAKNVEVCEPVYYVHQSTTAAITARCPNLRSPQFTDQPSTLSLRLEAHIRRVNNSIYYLYYIQSGFAWRSCCACHMSACCLPLLCRSSEERWSQISVRDNHEVRL